MMLDDGLLDEFKDRIIDRYTAAELVDLLGISVEDLLEITEVFDRAVESQLLQEELGIAIHQA